MRPATPPAIVPRDKLQFGLDRDIPRFWLNGDPFKTRFFDALSTLFPVGERFFITCVRDFKDRVTDPKLLQDIRDFTRQEGQHSILHTQYNDRLKAQGVHVDAILAGQEKRLFQVMRGHTSRQFTLALTAASEHITAIMADAFVERPEVFEGADERIRALYVWHAMEEMEHKAVAFDVLRDAAQGSYSNRVRAMLLVTILFPFHVFRIMRHMLRVDGFTPRQRLNIWVKGLWWLYKPGGVFMPMMGKYFRYLHPAFHPWDEPTVASYQPWVARLREDGDPIAASNALYVGATARR
ncbi:metal-dependent hydrolase [Aquabacterium sp.]|uniref:metal-dependent hydrolase n=1 Tax=Aquabacterium sp. TaxID=1872578 RepID=UPI0035AFFBC5